MNMMNGWGLQNLSRLDSSAIRQFCAARVEENEQEQEQQGEEVEMIWSSHDFISTDPPSNEVEEELVNTFFNAEYYERDNAFKLLEYEDTEEEMNEALFFDHLQQADVPSLYDESNMTSRMMIQAASNDIDGDGDDDDDVDDINGGVDEGLQLVHLLLNCAEAVGCRDAHLAHSILTQIWPCLAPWGRGDSLHRVSHCFALALNSRLSLLHNLNPNGSFSSRHRLRPNTVTIDDDDIDASNSNSITGITREEKSEAFTLLHQTTPYIAFGFFAANDAICQAASGKDSLHIIDLGMEHTLQWPSLLKMLSKSSISIRITGLIGDQDPTQLELSMRTLCKEAAALGISLEYNLLDEQVSPSTLTRENLQLRDDVALFVNSIMQLHKHVKESRGSLKTILQSIKKLRPVLVTVVEQDANHNGPFFLGRFLESLHYYSAIFDSLDASLPRDSNERMKIEKYHLSEEIWNVVACEGDDRIERHERADQWRRQLGRAGFQAAGFSYKSLNEARMMVSGYGCDGYTVGNEKGCLQLGWKGRPIMLASAWNLAKDSLRSILSWNFESFYVMWYQ